MNIVGEARFTVTRGDLEFGAEALVVRSLDTELLAGMPFLYLNRIGIFPWEGEIVFSDGSKLFFDNTILGGPPVVAASSSVVHQPDNKGARECKF